MKRYTLSLIILTIFLGGCVASTPPQSYLFNSSKNQVATSSAGAAFSEVRVYDPVKFSVEQKFEAQQAGVVAPNGVYVNVDGENIPRPYEAPSVPVGASAKCLDGSYSFSTHRQGTCSHHGGVEEWY